jgi:hypothetical protein
MIEGWFKCKLELMSHVTNEDDGFNLFRVDKGD